MNARMESGYYVFAVVMNPAVADRLAERSETGFQTPELSLPFRLLAGMEGSGSKVARPERFELPTSWFVAMRSIQLSYGRTDETVAARKAVTC
jgi:hypothetical protein